MPTNHTKKQNNIFSNFCGLNVLPLKDTFRRYRKTSFLTSLYFIMGLQMNTEMIELYN